MAWVYVLYDNIYGLCELVELVIIKTLNLLSRYSVKYFKPKPLIEPGIF